MSAGRDMVSGDYAAGSQSCGIRVPAADTVPAPRGWSDQESLGDQVHGTAETTGSNYASYGKLPWAATARVAAQRSFQFDGEIPVAVAAPSAAAALLGQAAFEAGARVAGRDSPERDQPAIGGSPMAASRRFTACRTSPASRPSRSSWRASGADQS